MKDEEGFTGRARSPVRPFQRDDKPVLQAGIMEGAARSTSTAMSIRRVNGKSRCGGGTPLVAPPRHLGIVSTGTSWRLERRRVCVHADPPPPRPERHSPRGSEGVATATSKHATSILRPGCGRNKLFRKTRRTLRMCQSPVDDDPEPGCVEAFAT